LEIAVSQAKERARAFVEGEKAFRLGELLTESFHPKTRELSQTMERDIRAGIRLLQSVDEDIPLALDRILAQESFANLVEALREAIVSRRRIFFTGCGATGRLSILLEAAWREFWRGVDQYGSQMVDLCISVMAGGDFALIKSVEGFEDFPVFGRHQLTEAGVDRDDVVVAITEGGETPFVIGTAWQGLETGAKVFFVYNNPTDLLRRHVQRSREVIDEPRIGKLDLATGPMAIIGSTRMQATTTELLVVGAAIEMAMEKACLGLVGATPRGCLSRDRIGSGQTQGSAPTEASRVYQRRFSDLLSQLSADATVETISRLVQFEEAVYRQHGLVTYVTDSALLDVLTDTTERAPTFMLPPFRRNGDTVSPVSWAFVKDPLRPTPDAWREMLQREPRGLTWGPAVYRQLNAPPALQANPPKLDNSEILRFQIGNEIDSSRTRASASALVFIDLGGKGMHGTPHEGFARTAAITVGPQAALPAVEEQFHFSCDLPVSPLRLWEHLAIKLILNTVSTATMVRMGRVVGNAMVWVSPSNKKLIDRGTRLIALSTGYSYEQACEALHEAMEEVARRARGGEEVPSPVALAIERIGSVAQEGKA
jgi:N-acetylmuramic acid 6-phosphate etherase